MTRRWFTRAHPRWPRRLEVSPLNVINQPIDSIGSLVFGIVLFVVLVFVVVPLLLFGVEVVIAAAIIGASMIGRLFFGRPWLVEAIAKTHPEMTPSVQYEVPGWRRSRALMQQVSTEIATGGGPRTVTANPSD